jgi:hypothetical protein
MLVMKEFWEELHKLGQHISVGPWWIMITYFSTLART